MKREYKDLCENKKEKEREEFIKEVGRAKSQGEIWEVIRKQRGGRKRVNEEIKEKEWRKYFMDLMGRSENKVKGGERRIEETTGNELERGEVEAVLRNLKRGKVAGEDGLVNEVCRYEGEGVKKGIWEICNGKGEGWRDDWNTGIVVPIVKKGEGRKVEEYRGVTLLDTTYKVYVGVLERRLGMEMEEKGMVPENQTGFRRNRGRWRTYM